MDALHILLFVLIFALTAVIIALVLRGGRSGRSASDPAAAVSDALDAMADTQSKLVRDEFERARESAEKSDARLREEVGKSLTRYGDSLSKTLSTSNETLGKTLVAATGNVSKTISEQMGQMRQSNEKKLEEMRTTVNEKLQGTLEKRLGEAFKQVSERLEAVQKGLGEMKQIAEGVRDFKKVLTNVKSRGTWGEVQLRAILEEMLAPSQWESNVQPRPGSGAIVECAIRLPGSGSSDQVWLPIDSKFPQEDYQRLQEAQDMADPEAVEEHSRKLETAIIKAATDIREKYIEPPHTTEFGILFLPTEGLYAEALRRPRVSDQLQQMRITLAGPTTLCSILNALQMGFHTLAIEKRSSEVWEVLAAVKTEFGKFGDVLARLKKQLVTAQNTIASTEQRTRVMERKLRGVEELPEEETVDLLGMQGTEPEE